ncbi:MAG: ROK family protein [Solobacterium sp.]|nr:ROK family protein [Solobacterium sp.]
MKTYAGIDIGGTQLRLGIFDENGNLLDVFKTDNDRSLGGEKNIDRLLAYAEKPEWEIRAYGIASPGPLDLKAGKILNPPNLYGWDNFEIVRYITEKTGKPCTVNNDGNLAGLAEARIGAGKGYDSVIFIGMSTGMGGSFVYKGELINGAHCNTAEFYNVIVNDDPYHHGSANPGSLNETAGGAAMERIASEAYGRQMFAKDLFQEYDKGNPKAAEILEKTSEALARGIADIYYIIDPDIYVIGGSIGLNNPWYIEKVFAKAKKYMTDPDIRTALSAFGDDAGLYGAMLAAKDIAE